MKKPVTNLPPYRRSIAGTLLRAREAVMGPIRPILRDADVTEQQWRVLRVLADEGAMDPSSLGVASILYAPSVTRILKELADRKLIEREIDANDRRRSIISISAKGRRLVEKVAQQTVGILKTYSGSFGEARLKRLIQELDAFAMAIDEAYGPESEVALGGRAKDVA